MKIKDKEYWYSAVSAYGILFPLNEHSQIKLSFKNNNTYNQMVPLLISNKGRYIYSKTGFEAEFCNGIINISGENVVEASGFGTLKGAYLDFIEKFSYYSNITLSSDFIQKPVYNTWIELTYNQNQEDILTYARSLVEAGLPAGTLIIDDGWSDYYGNWNFSASKFPDAKKMIQQLHELGFRVMLWVCPYLSPDTTVYRALSEKKILLTNGEEDYLLKWWNGYSACLDLRKPEAKLWLSEQLRNLQNLGVDGFKFDGGDSSYYLSEHEPDKQAYEWGKFAATYEFNEIRADFNTVGMSIMERLSDKHHSWGTDGLAALMPDTLALGLGGHPISSPDMIGGGEYTCFIGLAAKDLDKELFLKNAAVASVMPVVQFSVSPKRVLGDEITKLKELLKVRGKLQKYYEEAEKESRINKQPIIRYMEYEFPQQGMEEITDQFMVGENVLVAPNYKQNEKNRTVLLPKGTWIDSGGNRYENVSKPVTLITDKQIEYFIRF